MLLVYLDKPRKEYRSSPPRGQGGRDIRKVFNVRPCEVSRGTCALRGILSVSPFCSTKICLHACQVVCCVCMCLDYIRTCKVRASYQSISVVSDWGSVNSSERFAFISRPGLVAWGPGVTCTLCCVLQPQQADYERLCEAASEESLSEFLTTFKNSSDSVRTVSQMLSPVPCVPMCVHVAATCCPSPFPLLPHLSPHDRRYVLVGNCVHELSP